LRQAEVVGNQADRRERVLRQLAQHSGETGAAGLRPELYDDRARLERLNCRQDAAECAGRFCGVAMS